MLVYGLDTGLFDHEPVRAIFASHMNPELPVGKVGLIYGPCGHQHDPARGFQHALHSPHFNMDEQVFDVGIHLMGHALVQFIEIAQSP